jgi:hypothetical protein
MSRAEAGPAVTPVSGTAGGDISSPGPVSSSPPREPPASGSFSVADRVEKREILDKLEQSTLAKHPEWAPTELELEHIEEWGVDNPSFGPDQTAVRHAANDVEAANDLMTPAKQPMMSSQPPAREPGLLDPDAPAPPAKRPHELPQPKSGPATAPTVEPAPPSAPAPQPPQGPIEPFIEPTPALRPHELPQPVKPAPGNSLTSHPTVPAEPPVAGSGPVAGPESQVMTPRVPASGLDLGPVSESQILTPRVPVSESGSVSEPAPNAMRGAELEHKLKQVAADAAGPDTVRSAPDHPVVSSTASEKVNQSFEHTGGPKPGPSVEHAAGVGGTNATGEVVKDLAGSTERMVLKVAPGWWEEGVAGLAVRGVKGAVTGWFTPTGQALGALSMESDSTEPLRYAEYEDPQAKEDRELNDALHADIAKRRSDALSESPLPAAPVHLDGAAPPEHEVHHGPAGPEQ